ncbi:DUF47 domain-containing protein [Vibrio mediterranei]|uniref:DUF47 domain-containing protein n=1 Tax=Vibrio mediterranei TaxID=689 RepID=UPI0022844A62|nr:DUF47 family protein [Vibrio mediterranei]MCY9852631.1 DUF47 family protein [Vibrio mediterranei]
MSKNILKFMNNTIQLKNSIDSFYDLLGDSTSVFRIILDLYLKAGITPSKEDEIQIELRFEQLSKIELIADELRRNIESILYEKTLMPDLRGDLLKIIEGVDILINLQQASAFNLINERPMIPNEYHQDFLELQKTVAECCDHLVLGCRAFMRDQNQVRDHAHKVIFVESEADRISTQMKQKVFSSELELAQKIHIRYFIERIDNVANSAEDIADSLVIYAIKRSL